MIKKSFPLRIRFFLAMISLLLIASVIIAGVTVFRYKEEAEQYHRSRLERKEQSIKQNINYVLKRTTYPVTTKNIPLIFKENGRIYELSEVHKMPLIIYDLEGDLLIKSNESFVKDTIQQGIPGIVISKIDNSADKRYLVSYKKNGKRFQSSYSYITDNKFKPLAILSLPYLENDNLVKRDIRAFLKNLVEVTLFMLLICIGLAYLMSQYITSSIKSITDKLKVTRIGKQNKKIKVDNVSEEMATLISAYNGMVDQLEESAVKLAVSERENAWREMAKQVAHEIKNPLTPMRLTIQNFHRKFDCQDPNITTKLGEYSDTLIQQIDTMSAIASAFSNFAKMPERKDEILDLNEVVGLALEIFTEEGVSYHSLNKEIVINFDRTQLIRVVTNLVKNAIQATLDVVTPEINVKVNETNGFALIEITDNGCGIEERNMSKIFQPNFTTKSSGMGLGLAMVKSIVETYKGTILCNSEINKGTQFIIKIPLHK